MIGKPSTLRGRSSSFCSSFSIGIFPVISVKVLGGSLLNFAVVETLPGNKNKSQGRNIETSRIGGRTTLVIGQSCGYIF